MPPRINPFVEKLEPYVPGEQINAPDIIKLNTNECPFAPSASVEEVFRTFQIDRMRKYPEPTCRALREAVAGDLGLDPNSIVFGNGSDEILRLIFHAFALPGQRIATLAPTYSLYPVLGAMFGGKIESHPSGAEDPMPRSFIESDAAIKFLPNPNPPYGRQYNREEVQRLIERSDLVVLDEAYVDFADWNALDLREKFDNLLVTRSFSKSHALAGLRVGFGFGPIPLIERLHAIRDSYNVNGLSQAAALAAWNDKVWLARTVTETKRLKDYLTRQLRQAGFRVSESKGNFVFAEHALAEELASELRQRRILIRHFRDPLVRAGVRISIGTEEQIERLVHEVRHWLTDRGAAVNPVSKA